MAASTRLYPKQYCLAAGRRNLLQQTSSGSKGCIWAPVA